MNYDKILLTRKLKSQKKKYIKNQEIQIKYIRGQRF